jgi:hypothetical protein
LNLADRELKKKLWEETTKEAIGQTIRPPCALIGKQFEKREK